MSKKKVSGNTMTLKDFHGGSIPTDLPLPSAPGVYVSIYLDYSFRFVAFSNYFLVTFNMSSVQMLYFSYF